MNRDIRKTYILNVVTHSNMDKLQVTESVKILVHQYAPIAAQLFVCASYLWATIFDHK